MSVLRGGSRQWRLHRRPASCKTADGIAVHDLRQMKTDLSRRLPKAVHNSAWRSFVYAQHPGYMVLPDARGVHSKLEVRINVPIRVHRLLPCIALAGSVGEKGCFTHILCNRSAKYWKFFKCAISLCERLRLFLKIFNISKIIRSVAPVLRRSAILETGHQANVSAVFNGELNGQMNGQAGGLRPVGNCGRSKWRLLV
jgi:hypothetical protein